MIMNDEPPSREKQASEISPVPWMKRLFAPKPNVPSSRKELLTLIKNAAHNEVVDEEALHIIEGALDVAYQQVRDIMVPKAQMVCIQADESPELMLKKVIESAHSRFPVLGDSGDDVKGILLAKDLLPLILDGLDNFNIEKALRPANIIPESKRLNILLKEFRENRYHMAMVIDEYGGISGLVTIEDILEEIVGEIEDETDDDSEDFIRQVAENDFIIKALTPISVFNAHFNERLNDEEFDTVGGVVMKTFGHVPLRNEIAQINDYNFRVLYSDNRKIHLLRVSNKSKA